MSSVLTLLLLLAFISLSLLGSCERRVAVRSTERLPPRLGYTACSNTTSTEEGVTEWTCRSLQDGLRFVQQIQQQIEGVSSNTFSLRVSSGGDHVIESPVHLGSASVELVGVGSTAEPPVSIQCTYSIDVDQEQIFNLSYVYTDYTLYFNRSKSVSISNINMRGCQFPLRLDTIGRVEISNSSFTNFTEAVLDIFNVANSTILNSNFIDNRGTGISRLSFRANTGAVAMGFNNIELTEKQADPNILVSGCNFTRNRATAESFFRSTNTAFFSRIFTGRGGGLGMFINESLHNISGVISGNVFVDNYARSFGGGLYIVIFGGKTQNIFQVKRNLFVNNEAVLGAGGFLMTFFSVGLRDAPHTTNVTDCVFSGNVGESGGGVLSYIASEVFSFFKLERCNFTDNKGIGSINDFGSAYAVWLVENLAERASLPRYEITDCMFEDHVGSNGIVSIGYAPFAFRGRNVFSRNNGTSSLNIIGALVDIYGTMAFTSNEVTNAAALEFLSSGQVRLRNGAQLEFKDNRGRFGSSMIVRDEAVLLSFTNLVSNPHCFMLYEDRAVPPPEWQNVSVRFGSNRAVLSSAVYASSLRACTWISQSYPYFRPQSILEWPLWDLGNDSMNTGYVDKFSQKYHIGTEAVAIDTPNASILAWPGYEFKLPVAGWDEFNNPTAVATRLEIMGNREAQVSFLPEVVVIETTGVNSTLASEFTVKYRLSQSNLVLSNGSVGQVVLNAPFQNNENTSPDRLQLFSELCPGGYELSNTLLGMECGCLEKTVDRIVHCEDDQQSIIVQRGYWVAAVPSNKTHNHMMHFYTCPAGYCRCVQNSSVGTESCVYLYVNSDPDAQCSCRRHGILCGSCESGGVSALLDRCVSCSNAFIVLVPLLVVILVALFITIVLVDKHPFSLFYPFTFYVQVISFSGLYFHESFLDIGKYLRYLGSALSFYFPYDFCLYSSLDPLVSYALRLLPVVVALVVVPITILSRNLKGKRKLKHHGVWTIVLLIYTHTVHTCMSVLNCPVIIDENETSANRWFVNGNMNCFTSGHLPVTLLVLFAFLISILMIPIVAAIATGKLSSISGWEWTKYFQQPLIDPYKEKFRWWSAIELLRRLIFILLIILFPRKEVAALLFQCIVLFTYGFYQPYKDMEVNIFELLVNLNSFILLNLVSSGVLDPYYALSMEGGSSSSSGSCSPSSSGTTVATWILTPLYYFPIPLLLAFILLYFRSPMRNLMVKSRIFALRQKLQSQKTADPEYATGYFPMSEVSGTEVFLSDLEDEILVSKTQSASN